MGDRNRLKLWYVSGVQDLSKERGTFVVFSQLDLNEEVLRKDAGIILKNGTSFHQGINNAALCLADTLDILPHDTVIDTVRRSRARRVPRGRAHRNTLLKARLPRTLESRTFLLTLWETLPAPSSPSWGSKKVQTFR